MKEVFLIDGFGMRYRNVQLEAGSWNLLSEEGNLHDESFQMIAEAAMFQDFGITIKAEYIKPWPPKEAEKPPEVEEEKKEQENKEEKKEEANEG